MTAGDVRTTDRALRILLWPSGFPPRIGGVEAICSELAAALQARGHAVAVLTPDGSGSPRDDVERGVTVHRLPLHEALESRDPARVLRARRAVTERLRAFAPDVVHVHAFQPALFFALGALPAPLPLLFSIHALPPLQLDADGVPGRVLRRADWVTACARSLLERAVAAAPEIAGRASVVPNARPPGPPPVAAPPGPPTALCVGRLAASKGFERALEAFADALREAPDARMRIVGDGPEREALERRADALGLRGRVELAGAVAPGDVAKWLDAAHVVVIPSRGEEGMPLIALEAAQRARPVVAFGVDGIPEAVLHGRTGVVVPPDDVTALGAALGALLRDLPGAAALGTAARDRAQREFGWERHVERTERLYQKLTPGNP